MEIDKLRRFVDVDYESGAITWRARVESDFKDTGKGGAKTSCRRFNTTFAGKPALNHKSNGYMKGRIDGFELKAHRVVWAHFHGRWPDGEIDHINRVRDDNRIMNLRDVSRSENALNKAPGRNGSYIYEVSKPWFGSRIIDGVEYRIEPQETKEKAVLDWRRVERESIPMDLWVYNKPE